MPNATLVGATLGNFSVDPDGGATYAVSIVVPPGTAGMEPRIALGYNSAMGDGLLGIGFSLQGLSAIVRAPRTMAQDGVRGAIAYDEHDRFSLDGQRLMVVNGVDYGDADALFHTEIESWQRAVPTYSGSVSGRSGPDSFTLKSKDGQALEYGGTPDSQVLAVGGPHVRIWALNRVTDAFGNSMIITYVTNADGSLYPSRIDYTSNTAAGLISSRAVTFSYETRPDAHTVYSGGYGYSLTQRLTEVQTLLEGKPVRTYALSYEQSAMTGKSRLLSLQESGIEGSALPPTSFSWQGAGAGDSAWPGNGADVFSGGMLLAATSVPWQGELMSVDIDGDGRTDAINLYVSGGHLGTTFFLSDGKSLVAQPPLPTTTIPYSPGTPIVPLDSNGNGRTDLVCAVRNGNTLGLTLLTNEPDGNGGWTFSQGPLNGAGPNMYWGGTLYALDVDGDGLTDLVYAYNHGGTLALAVLFSDGRGNFAPSPTDATSPTVAYAPGGQLLTLDFNGDGMTDLVYAVQSGNRLHATLFLSQGRTGFVQQGPEATQALAVLPSGGTLMSYDVNADGLGDLVLVYRNNGLVVTPILSNGVAFTAAPAVALPLSDLGTGTPLVVPMELNGDGLAELLVASGSGTTTDLNVLVWTEAGYALLPQVTPPGSSCGWGSSLLPMDYDGDGRTDLVFASTHGGTTSFGTTRPAGVYPDLLASVTDGLGGVYAALYLPLTDPSVYTNAISENDEVDAGGLMDKTVPFAVFPVSGTFTATSITPAAVPTTRSVDFPKYVVATYSKSDGRGSTYEFIRSYAGALVDTQGRGWLGFAWFSHTDKSVDAQTTIVNNQTFPLIARAAGQTMQRASDGALMQSNTFTYATAENGPNTGPGVWTAWNTRNETDHFTFALGPNPSPDVSESMATAYDDFGNPTTVTATGDIQNPAIPGSQTYTTQTWNNDTPGFIGLLATRIVSEDAQGTQVLRSEKNAYDALGLMLSQQVWDSGNQTWLNTTYAYDSFGNPTQMTDSTGAITVKTYDSQYSTFVVETTLAVNGPALSAQNVYAPQFGAVQQTTSPCNTVTRQTFDGIGRASATIGPDLSGNPITLQTTVYGSDSTGNYRETQTRLDWEDGWNWSREYIDGLGQLYRVAMLGADGQRTVLLDRKFDSRSSVVQESFPYYEGETPQWTTHEYDAYGRLIQTVAPLDGGATTTTTFDWQRSDTVVRTDAAGTPEARTLKSEYVLIAGKPRPVSQTDALGMTTTFDYDALGQMVKATDPLGIVTLASYDTVSRKIGSSVASSTRVYQKAEMTFPAGKPLATQVSGDETTTFEFDALMRIVSRTVGGKTTQYQYDTGGGTNTQGRLARVILPNGEGTTFGYDIYGNPVEAQVVLAGNTYTFGKTFAPRGRVLTQSFPDGSVQDNAYNAGGFLETIGYTPSGGSRTVYATYSEFTTHGLPGSVAYRNGVVETLGYSLQGNLDSQAVDGPTGALLNATFQRNALLNVVEVARQGRQAQAFAYDAVGRLLSATGDYGTLQYAYDAGGNLVQKAGIDYTYDGYQAISGVKSGESVFSAIYDDQGSMTSAVRNGNATPYEYDAQRRLVQAGGCTFTYDQDGQRLSKSSEANTTHYPDPTYEITQITGGGSFHTTHLVGAFGLVASIAVGDGGTRNTLYYHHDQVKSTVLQTDATGAVVNEIEYLPYGEIANQTGANAPEYAFASKIRDGETGLCYFGSRYYDPSLGRFLSADDRLGADFSIPDAFNRYAYVLNNPLSGMDPTGHSAIGNWFKNHWQEIVSYTADALLIAAGVIALVGLSALGCPTAGKVLGGALLGAGISGLAYNISNNIVHRKFSWGEWGVQLGVGAVMGAIGAGLGIGASAAVEKATAYGAAAVLMETMSQGGATALRIGTSALLGTAIGASLGFTTQIVTNKLTNCLPGEQKVSLWSGIGFATLFGGIAGGLSGLAGEAMARYSKDGMPESEERLSLRRGTSAEKYGMEGADDPYSILHTSPTYGTAILPIPQNIFMNALPGNIFGFIATAFVVNPGWKHSF